MMRPSAWFVMMAVGAGAGGAHGESVYLAMGDSIGFGYTTRAELDYTFADQGYVRHYANALGRRMGVRPAVVNLSIPQETSGSFFIGGMPATVANLHYPTPMTSQMAMLSTVVADRHALGDTIDHVTIALGTNDLLGLGDDPGFLAAPPQEQATRILDVLVSVGNNMNSVLDAVVALAPEAMIIVPGYYNPYAATPDHPIAPIAPIAIEALNEVLRIIAEGHQAMYVDVASAFSGREPELTYMLTDDPVGSNFHPTREGYRVIARAIAAPAPGSLAVAATVLPWVTRRRRAAGR